MGYRSASMWDVDRAIVFGVGPAVVGNDGGPAGAAGILIVGVAAETLVELGVFAQFFAIELDAEAGLIGDADRAVLVAHEPALNHIVLQVMVVGIGGEGEVRDHGAEMQHGGELNADRKSVV